VLQRQGRPEPEPAASSMLAMGTPEPVRRPGGRVRLAVAALAGIAYGRFGFGSGIAAELGLLAIVGIGSAATRSIS
jgi:hypothetical protein